MCGSACMCRGQRPTSQSSSIILYLSFETSLPEPRTRSATPASLKAPELHLFSHPVSFRTGAGDPDSGPRVSEAYSLPAETSSQPTSLVSYNCTDLYKLAHRICSVLDECLPNIPKNYCTGEAAQGEDSFFPPLKEGHDEGRAWGKFLSL